MIGILVGEGVSGCGDLVGEGPSGVVGLGVNIFGFSESLVVGEGVLGKG